MTEILTNIHNIWRYVALIAAVLAIVMAVLAMTGSRPWDATSDRFSLLFTISMDVQVLIGILVWVLESRWNFNDTFLSLVHPVLMLGAVGLAHVGRTRADRATDSKEKGRQALIFFAASLVVVLIAVPLAAWPL